MPLRLLKRLAKEERGNILYMAVVLVMVLVTVSLVLVNVIYLGVLKIRAQNTADQLALSGATLKARLLNKITNVNGCLFNALEGGVINQEHPYASLAAGLAGQAAMETAYNDVVTTLIPEYHAEIENKFDYVAEGNGLDLKQAKFGVFPYEIRIADPYGQTNRISDISVVSEPIACKVAPPPAPLRYLSKPIVAFEPTNTWFVQSRVNLSTSSALVGGALLGIHLPEINARARAELIDKGNPIPGLSKHITHNWRVRLATPDDRVDQELCRRTGSNNTLK